MKVIYICDTCSREHERNNTYRVSLSEIQEGLSRFAEDIRAQEVWLKIDPKKIASIKIVFRLRGERRRRAVQCTMRGLVDAPTKIAEEACNLKYEVKP